MVARILLYLSARISELPGRLSLFIRYIRIHTYIHTNWSLFEKLTLRFSDFHRSIPFLYCFLVLSRSSPIAVERPSFDEAAFSDQTYMHSELPGIFFFCPPYLATKWGIRSASHGFYDFYGRNLKKRALKLKVYNVQDKFKTPNTPPRGNILLKLGGDHLSLERPHWAPIIPQDSSLWIFHNNTTNTSKWCKAFFTFGMGTSGMYLPTD